MKTLLKPMTAICLILCTLGSNAQARSYIPSESNLKAREKFQDDKFGIFIHWGIYSMLADGEWVMNQKKLNYKEYEKIAGGFYPSKFNAEEWVKAIKASGAKYITITSRHHDGFSMFKSEASSYNIVDATPFGRDILKELAVACKKEGITLNFYYSHVDWYRSDYPIGDSGRHSGRPAGAQNWNSYFNFMNMQLKELLTNYGKVGMIWFDGYWDHRHDKPAFDWHLEEQYALIHSLNPACLIANNHHSATYDGEDVQVFEKDLPGENKAGFSGGVKIGELPLETCETMNNSWGYNIRDNNYKPLKDIIHLMVNAAGKGGNLLLNIGPQPDGNLPAMALKRLDEIGEWMKKYGESIYGTRAGIFPPQYWGASTRKGDKVYIHILNLNDKSVYVPTGKYKVKTAKTFEGKEKLNFTQCPDGIVLHLAKVPDEIDYIVELN